MKARLPFHFNTGAIKENFSKLRKKKKFKVGAAISLVLVVAIVGGVVYQTTLRGEAVETTTTVSSATAETGSISTTIEGTGTIASGSTTDVVVPAGIIIDEVLVESGDSVTEGQQLATVNTASIASELIEVNESIEAVEEEISNLSSEASTEGTTEYLEAIVLNGELEDLTEAQTALNALLASPVITATCAGTISSINVSADTEISSSSSGSSSGSASTVNTAATITSGSEATSGDSSDDTVSLVQLTTTTSSSDSTTSESEEATTASAEESEDSKIEECVLEITAPVTGAEPQTEIEETDEYTGTITWNCSTDTFQEDTVYTATIKLTAKDGYVFSENIIPEVSGADVNAKVTESDSGDSILVIKAQFAKTASASSSDNSTSSGSKSDSTSSGSASENTTESSTSAGASGNVSSDAAASESSSAASASGSSSASSSDSSTSTDSFSSDSTTSTATYSAYEASAFSIASESEVVVSISVDELDILSVAEGQTAQITMDALENQEFTGTITSVSDSASGDSSSAKYTVEITMERTEDMKLGMSASATIYVDESENAVLIPVSALQESGDTTFVYTGTDSEGNLTDKVEVETGLSNGNQVEITSGLEEGDTVYYLKSDSTDSTESTDMMGGDMGSMGDMGEMPSGGGDMPSGGGGGSAPSGGGQ